MSFRGLDLQLQNQASMRPKRWPRLELQAGGSEAGAGRAEELGPPGARRSQLADREGGKGGPARAERRGLSQAPRARCRWQLGGATATVTRRARVWRPLSASGSPFPPPSLRRDPGKSERKSGCVGTCEQPYLSAALAPLFRGTLDLEAAKRFRGRYRGRLPVTQAPEDVIPLRSGNSSSSPLASTLRARCSAYSEIRCLCQRAK
ncbi:uncharacterized protein LOC123826332 [Phyllostomus hastatus]|uniref:uncharacterized protein LOC123826332 n=1 Tax=Phyllostomus hastatus TaxID=9423 RepID=UPI001E67EA61|nr:uncharacterized protein LOC123826332 [Phyllostomus hastatus]